MKERRKIDPEKQYAIALDAFLKNGYFVLIDNIQAEDPEQMVVINAFMSHLLKTKLTLDDEDLSRICTAFLEGRKYSHGS